MKCCWMLVNLIENFILGSCGFLYIEKWYKLRSYVVDTVGNIYLSRYIIEIIRMFLRFSSQKLL